LKLFSKNLSLFLQVFAKSLVKTLKHGDLHKKLLLLERSPTFVGFSQNAIPFATSCEDFGQIPKTC